MTHGTHAGYSNGCRCDDCKTANRKYHQDLRERKKAGNFTPLPRGKRTVGSAPARKYEHNWDKPGKAPDDPRGFSFVLAERDRLRSEDASVDRVIEEVGHLTVWGSR